MIRHGNSTKIALRREAVARLALRGMSIRQIERTLPGLSILNEKDKPFKKSTINSDLQYLRGQWLEHAKDDIAEHQAQQLAMLEEVQREAWAARDLELVLKTHDRISKLLGTNAPDKMAMTDDDGKPTAFVVKIVSPDEKKDSG